MRTYDIDQPITFKRGVYQLNDNDGINFQLNRTVNWDGGRLKDVAAVSRSIHTIDDWKRALIGLGDVAMSEDRVENAIGYYRMSEFLMRDDDPDKLAYYHKARDLFYAYYADYFAERDGAPAVVERLVAPYDGIELPVMHARPEGTPSGTIVFHGGNDSYFEELFFPMLYLRERGYDVYLFEGPGQGSVLRDAGVVFTHEWERPVAAVLDAFDLADVTIVGVSLGGYFAPRAAAFEKRISRVVAWTVFPSFLGAILSARPTLARMVARAATTLHANRAIDAAFTKAAEKGDPSAQWVINHGVPAYGATTVSEYVQKLRAYDLAPVADKIDQDILIIGASKDHFVDYTIVGDEIRMLRNVRSLTFRLMTEAEDACNHCSAGNTKLVMDTICQWLAGLDVRDEG